MEKVQSWAEVGERIAEARQAAGLSQAALADRVGLDRTKIVRIESGDRKITALELFALSEALDVPSAHFVSRPTAAMVSRRGALDERADAASRERYRLDMDLEIHARNAHWLVQCKLLKPAAPGGIESLHDPRALAVEARKALGKPSGPVGPMADVAEELGLYLTVVARDGEGASMRQEGYGVAVLSGKADPGRRRWTAAHELGHHLIQDEYHSDVGVAASRDEREQLIDQFAEEFLLPGEDFHRAWKQGRHAGQTARETLISLSASYRLSWSAVVNRAHCLQAVDATEARRLKPNSPVDGDFLTVVGRKPAPDLEVGATGVQWRRAVLAAWNQGDITAPRVIELLYGALEENELPSRDLTECPP